MNREYLVASVTKERGLPELPSDMFGLGKRDAHRWLVVVWTMVLALSCSAQDSINVSLSGSVIDQLFLRPIDSATVEVVGMDGSNWTVATDTSGAYSITLNMPMREGGTGLVVLCSSEEKLSAKDQIAGLSRDTVLEKNFSLRWSGPCIDTFAPGFLHFEKNSTTLADSTLELLVAWVRNTEEILNGNHRILVDVFTASSLDEPEIISAGRADFLKQALTLAGISDTLLRIEDLGHRDFYYCRFCEGCIPRFMYGEGDLLSKENIETSTRREELNAMRRVGHIAFGFGDEPQRDRTQRPKLGQGRN
jgi:hypothetical protein